jgi:hypothetical protein
MSAAGMGEDEGEGHGGLGGVKSRGAQETKEL